MTAIIDLIKRHWFAIAIVVMLLILGIVVAGWIGGLLGGGGGSAALAKYVRDQQRLREEEARIRAEQETRSAEIFSALVIAAGIVIAVAGLLLVALVAKEKATTIFTYALGALGILLGTGSANIWAAQKKSGVVLAAQASADAVAPAAIATPSPTVATTTIAREDK